jgi:hypothetical protein
MSKDEDRTLVRRPGPEPTSWNGISYDDMMRSLEGALPEDDRATLVGLLPTRPVSFEPLRTTQPMIRLPGEAPVQSSLAPVPLEQAWHPNETTTVAPVAMPSRFLRYVDLDADPDLELDVPVLAPRRRRVAKGFGVLAGAMFGVIVAAGCVTWRNPAVRTSAGAAANETRARVSAWVSSVTANGSNEPSAAAAAPPPATTAIPPPMTEAPPAVAAEAPTVPQMRAPTPPPARTAKAIKRADSEDDRPAEAAGAPSSLLDRGLGE